MGIERVGTGRVGAMLAFLAMAAALAVGCGGGSGSTSASSTGPRTADAAVKAVGAWADAVMSFYGQFQTCSGQVHPVHNFYKICMKQPQHDYLVATRAARRALTPDVRGSASCRRAATTIESDVSTITGIYQQTVRVANKATNSATDNRRYHGPGAAILSARAQRLIPRDTADARKLSRSLACG